MDSAILSGDKQSGKKNSHKFCTYQRCIILFILLFFKKEKKKKYNIVMLKTEWKEQGFIDEPVKEGTDLKAEIRRLQSRLYLVCHLWYNSVPI